MATLFLVLNAAPGRAGVSVTGDTAIAATSTDDSFVGSSGIGTLRIDLGSTLADYRAYIGFSAGSIGTVNVDGAASMWSNSRELHVGENGQGSMWIESGATVRNTSGFLGYAGGSGGSAVVSGSGSMWINSGGLYVGRYGAGSLDVRDGGQVFNTGASLGYFSGATGNASVTGATSKWTSTQNLVVGGVGNGTLVVQDGGTVSSVGGYVANNSNVTGTVTLRGTGSTWVASGDFQMCSGSLSKGTLVVEGGGQVSDANVYLACASGTSSTVTVNGAGSAWTNSGILYVGYTGNGAVGSLAVQAGAQVSNTVAYLGTSAGTAGTATVVGPGSIWGSSGALFVGKNGTGTLTVADGARVTARNLSIGSGSTVQLHVSGNGAIVLGSTSLTGDVSNSGTVAFYVSAMLAPGVYSPITEFAGRNITWSGSGSYRSYGCTWNSTDKTLAVDSPTTLLSGDVELLRSGERLLVLDSAGQRAGASFGSVGSGTAFSAKPMSKSQTLDLAPLLKAGDEVLAAWDITCNWSGGDAMLSLDVGTGIQDLSFWHFQNGAWSVFTPTSASYGADGIANFTVNSFSGYAVTGNVPEPQLFWLICAGALTVGRRRRGH